MFLKDDYCFFLLRFYFGVVTGNVGTNTQYVEQQSPGYGSCRESAVARA